MEPRNSNYAIQTMPGELKSGLGISVSIDIPPVPTSFYPGHTPASALMAAASGAAAPSSRIKRRLSA